MNLKEFLFYTDMSANKFAKLSNLCSAHICHLLSGKIKPTRKSIKLIEIATHGLVNAESFFKPTNIPENAKKFGEFSK